MSEKTVAVCMICKNEEALIGRALESVKEADAIYILDTGSQDKTIQIAQQYTDYVFIDYVWADDFSSAQNLIKSRAKEDFILSLDCDEQLLVPFEEVRKAIELAKDTVRVTMVPEGDVETTVFGFPRLFRNSPDIEWVGAIHKHLNLPGDGEEVGDVRIMYGWSPAHDRDPDRSLRILEKTVKEENNPVRNLYYLGREYWYKQRYWECIDTFRQYAKVAHWPGELADAYLTMAQAYAALGKEQECADACFQAILINANFKEAIQYMASIVMPWNKQQWQRMARTASNEGLVWKRVGTEPNRNIVLLSPHSDDEVLFAGYTLMRYRPQVIVITESHIQDERGEVGCDAETRRQESIAACGMLGCPVSFLGIRDSELTEEILKDRLKDLDAETIYIPAYHEKGNPQHNLVNKVARGLFKPDQIEQYTSYSKTDLLIKGNHEIIPAKGEIELKNRAMDCYKSQINLNSMASHFEFIRNKSEWLL